MSNEELKLYAHNLSTLATKTFSDVDHESVLAKAFILKMTPHKAFAHQIYLENGSYPLLRCCPIVPRHSASAEYASNHTSSSPNSGSTALRSDSQQECRSTELLSLPDLRQ